MYQFCGVCAGTWVGSMMSLDAGNLRKYPMWITNFSDSFLISVPFLLAATHALSKSFINGYVTALYMIQTVAVLRTSDMHGRFYGLRFALPLISGSALNVFALYRNSDWPPQLLFIFGLMGTTNLAFVVSLCTGDCGMYINRFTINGLQTMSEERWIAGTVKLMLIAMSSYLILVAGLTQSKSLFVVGLMASIVFLSILSSNNQRGSIVSAALVLYVLSLISQSVLSVPVVAVAAAGYNNFILNSESHMTELDIPLLDDPNKFFRLTKSQIENSRFRFMCNNLLLSAIFSLDSFFEPVLFLHVSLVVYLWILLAPYVLRDRNFAS